MRKRAHNHCSVAQTEEIPSPDDQETIRQYCISRQLSRPETTLKTVLLWLGRLEILAVIGSIILTVSLDRLGISSIKLFSSGFFLLFYATSMAVFMVYAKKTLIMAVELYQRYAPDDVRRRCKMMPSCSEYAILALRKHGVMRGVRKTYVRLTKRCKGDTYQIDYP